MKARRVAILLGILAISALTMFLVLLLDSEARAQESGGGVSGPALPDTLLSYEETVRIGPDGDSAVEIAVVIGKGGHGDLLLPFDFGVGDDFALLSGPASFRDGSDGRPQPLVRRLGRSMLNLETTPEAAAGDEIRVTASLPGWYDREGSKRPFGEYSLKHGYVNASRFVMRDFRQTLALPPGMVVHSVTKVVPEYDAKKNPSPPFDFGADGDRVTASVRVADLPPAGVARLELNIRTARRGLVPLVLGILAALLYLVFYRDVLKPKETE